MKKALEQLQYLLLKERVLNPMIVLEEGGHLLKNGAERLAETPVYLDPGGNRWQCWKP